ncbi:ArsC/Spx/MgsR family protein [Streptococcus caprae]|uniref:ArsC/Spx/MgsR family protein n=1 Tax=Streptococcus caprae TaxID=1640501 RepID=A0ABV8CTV7_9STRE
MTDITIYHNQSCSKSNKVLELIEEAGYDLRVVNYLENVPTVDDLKNLGLPAQDLIRKTDKLYRELNLPAELTDQAIYETLVQYPSLIQRPIVTTAKGSLICRPPERVWELMTS